jgi:hypothetical protein
VSRRKSKWEWVDANSGSPIMEIRCANVSEQEILWRLRGYLDCLRALAVDGPPDPKYIEWVCDRVGEPLVSLSYLEKLRRVLRAETAE